MTKGVIIPPRASRYQDIMPPSAYVESMAGFPVRRLPGMDLTPVSTNLFNSDFNLTLDSPLSTSCSTSTTSCEVDPFDATFHHAKSVKYSNYQRKALMALLTQATKESHRLNSSGAIMYFDNPLTLQHRALMSPPLPLYNSKFKKSHFIIPISGHVERNEDTSLISTEEVLPEPAFPTTECPSFPLPPPEVIQKVYQKNLEKEKLYLKFIADLVERPEPTQNYIFQMPFQSHKNVSYHGHFPRLIYFGCLSTPIHAHAQVIAFSNRNITALDLDSKPNIMSTFSPDLFSRAYFGMSRITDGHMHSTRPDEIPRKVVKIPLVPIPKAFLTPATPTPNIPALFLDFVEEAEQRNIGKFFNEEERQKEYSFGKYIQSNGSSKKSTITSLTALPSKLPYLEEISHVDTGDSLKLSSVLRLPIMNPSVENFRNHSGTIIDPGSIQQAHSITMSEFSKNAAIYNRSMELQQESKKKRAVEKAEIRLRKRSNIEFNAALPLENAKRLEKLEKNRKSAVKSREKKKRDIDDSLNQIRDMELRIQQNTQLMKQLLKDQCQLMHRVISHDYCLCRAMDLYMEMQASLRKDRSG